MIYHLSVVNKFYLKQATNQELAGALNTFDNQELKRTLVELKKQDWPWINHCSSKQAAAQELAGTLDNFQHQGLKAGLGRTKNKLKPWTVPPTKEYSESWKNKRLCLSSENIVKIIT